MYVCVYEGVYVHTAAELRNGQIVCVCACVRACVRARACVCMRGCMCTQRLSWCGLVDVSQAKCPQAVNVCV